MLDSLKDQSLYVLCLTYFYFLQGILLAFHINWDDLLMLFNCPIITNEINPTQTVHFHNLLHSI